MLPNNELIQNCRAALSALDSLECEAGHVRVGRGGVVITISEKDFRRKFAGQKVKRRDRMSVECQVGEITYEAPVFDKSEHRYPHDEIIPVAEAACEVK